METSDMVKLLLVCTFGFFFVWGHMNINYVPVPMKSHERFNKDIEFIPFNSKEFLKRCMLPKR